MFPLRQVWSTTFLCRGAMCLIGVLRSFDWQSFSVSLLRTVVSRWPPRKLPIPAFVPVAHSGVSFTLSNRIRDGIEPSSGLASRHLRLASGLHRNGHACSLPRYHRGSDPPGTSTPRADFSRQSSAFCLAEPGRLLRVPTCGHSVFSGEDPKPRPTTTGWSHQVTTLLLGFDVRLLHFSDVDDELDLTNMLKKKASQNAGQ